MYPRTIFLVLFAFCLSVPLGLTVCEPRLYGQEDSAFDDFGDFEETNDSGLGEEEDDTFSTSPTPQTRPDAAFSGGVRKLPASLVPSNPAELSAEEALALLDKLEKDFYEKPENISPLEMIQAVYLFCKHGNEQLSLPFMKSLLIRFNTVKLSERALFDIADQLGGPVLAQILAQRSLAPESEEAVERMLEAYQAHLKKKNAVELFLTKDYLKILSDPNAETELKAPEELVFAANEISKGPRLEIAGVLLKRFLDTQTTPEQLHQINENISPTDIIRMLTLPELQPTGQLAAKRIIEGADAYRKSQSPTPQTPVRGPLVFWKGTETALEDLIELLCKSQDEKEVEQLETTFESFGMDALFAAAVVLESGNDLWVARCAHFLRSRLDPEMAYLLFPAMFDAKLQPATRAQIGQYVEQLTVSRPDAFDAATDLYKIATQYNGRELALRINADGNVLLWTPNDKGLPQCVLFPAVNAYRFQTARFAEQAYKIFPQQQEIKTLYHLAVLDRLVNENGLDQPQTEKIQQFTKDWTLFDLEAVLVEAIHRNLTGAGVTAAQQLGTRGTADELLMQTSEPALNVTKSASVFVRPRALVRATQCSDRRIRFAATEAVMKLKPTKAYPGSSFVSDSLMFFANAEGRKVAIIAAPKIADAMKLSGFLIKLGYATKIVTDCRDIIMEASHTPDVELVLVDQRCRNPSIEAFAKHMYNNPATRDIPVAILSFDEKILRKAVDDSFAEKPLPLLSEREKDYSNTVFANTLAMVFPHPQDEEAARYVVQRLRKMTGTNEIPNAQRLEHAKWSLRRLGEITRDYPHLYRVENLELLARKAAYSPELASEGIELLAQIRSNVMQNTLANIAMLKNIPDDVRDRAATAFEQSVHRHGILIRGRQVKTLLDIVADPEESDLIYQRLESTIQSAASRSGQRR